MLEILEVEMDILLVEKDLGDHCSDNQRVLEDVLPKLMLEVQTCNRQ